MVSKKIISKNLSQNMTSKKIISKKEKSDPIFLPFNYEAHKENKVTLMKAELAVIRCLRILENLKRFQEEKCRLRKELQHMLSSSTRDFEKTIEEMPTINNSKEIIRIEQTINTDFGNSYEEKLRSLASAGADRTALGKELSIIQDKLKKLSNYQ